MIGIGLKKNWLAHPYQNYPEATPPPPSLDLDRNLGSKVGVKKKVQLGRRAMYSLMGAGAHGRSGMNPLLSFHRWKTFALPRMLYFCLFVFVASRPMSTAMVIAGRSVHLTTLFPGQA